MGFLRALCRTPLQESSKTSSSSEDNGQQNATKPENITASYRKIRVSIPQLTSLVTADTPLSVMPGSQEIKGGRV